MGLGPLGITPSTSIVLIHGLKTPFAFQRGMDGDLLLGECYVHGLMDEGIGTSSDDICLDIV